MRGHAQQKIILSQEERDTGLTPPPLSLILLTSSRNSVMLQKTYKYVNYSLSPFIQATSVSPLASSFHAPPLLFLLSQLASLIVYRARNTPPLNLKSYFRTGSSTQGPEFSTSCILIWLKAHLKNLDTQCRTFYYGKNVWLCICWYCTVVYHEMFNRVPPGPLATAYVRGHFAEKICQSVSLRGLGYLLRGHSWRLQWRQF